MVEQIKYHSLESISKSLVVYANIAAIQREEEKVKRTLKDAAKKGDKTTAAILAKEVVHSRKAISRIYASKAQINSVDMSVKNQAGKKFEI